MHKKIHLGILFGGRSAEHEVSVTSARSMLEALDRDKYEVTMIGIDKQGRWLLSPDAQPLLQRGRVEEDENSDLQPVLLDYPGSRQLIAASDLNHNAFGRQLEVIFPLLHGPYGEDGTMQGLLELADIAYVGSGVVGSAVGMDKEMAKRVFASADLQQADYSIVKRFRWQNDSESITERILSERTFPVFVKPANLGSSVGISKAHDKQGLINAINLALQFDRKIVIEQSLENCHEVECSILGNDEPIASVVGEIIPGAEFYDYQTKYIDDKSELVIPARISEQAAKRVQEMAIRAFSAVEAAGLARVDFFVSKDNEDVYINEINTMPGFTPISMYPKLWQASGIGYSELIDRLIELALERKRENETTITSL